MLVATFPSLSLKRGIYSISEDVFCNGSFSQREWQSTTLGNVSRNKRTRLGEMDNFFFILEIRIQVNVGDLSWLQVNVGDLSWLQLSSRQVKWPGWKYFIKKVPLSSQDSVWCRLKLGVQTAPRSHLQLEVEVLWVEVVNPDVSVLSSAAVTASITSAVPGSALAKVLVWEKDCVAIQGQQFTGGSGAYLLPSGWNATQLMGPKWPLTLPNSSS